MDVTTVIRVLFVVFRKILLGHSWSSMFNSCGYTDTPHVWSSQIQAIFNRVENVPVSVPDEPPNTEQVLHILPKQRKYAMGALLWKVPTVRPAFKFTLPRVQMPCPRLAENSDGFHHTSLTAFRPVSGVSAGGGSSTDPIAWRTRSRSYQIIESAPPHSAAAASVIPTQPCPSSTSVQAVAETVNIRQQQRWCPQARSQPKKRIRISSGTAYKI